MPVLALMQTETVRLITWLEQTGDDCHDYNIERHYVQTHRNTCKAANSTMQQLHKSFNLLKRHQPGNAAEAARVVLHDIVLGK